MFEEYLLSFHREELLEIIKSDDKTKYLSININFIELHERNIELAITLLDHPEISLEEWDKAAVSAQMTLLRQIDKNKYVLKIKVHCRIHYLAHLARRSVFPGNREAGKFTQISGTVVRRSDARLLEYQRNYICTKCKTPNIVKANYERKYMIIQPTRCQNEGCDGTNINLVHFGELDSENCKDYQEIKVQEQVKKLGICSIPNTIRVTLEDDLVDICQPGDDITICGIVKRQFGEFIVGKRTEMDLVFKANHVQVDTGACFIFTPETTNMFSSFWEKYAHNPLEGRDIILKSFCPQIYGLYPVKLAMCVVLAGGCPIEDLTGLRTRSESHLLLVGDPGTGKSQLLRFASKIVPRAVLTTGVGSTAAGLTVTATMENGEWQLEAGALVIADGGICCIDEFNSMKQHDRTTVHEAMEQQTISVAKAGIICKLNTRCSILAACNPKGNLDPTQPLSMNVALPSPLLSRFDLVMLMRDTVNQEWDELVIDYILNGGNDLSKLTDSGLWSISILQSYFKLIKKSRPKLTKDAEEILSTYYNIQRRPSSRNKARTTVRLLESLVRLSQGHAKLMYHEKVLVIDSIYAVFLVDFSMDPESSIFNLNICTNAVFPKRPKSTYKNLLETVLNKLQLQQILENELNHLSTDGEGILQSRFFVNPNENEQNVEKSDGGEIIIDGTEDNSKRSESFEVNDKGGDINDKGGTVNDIVKQNHSTTINSSPAEHHVEVVSSDSKVNVNDGDLDLLNLIPSVNDGFCADLNMNWDSEEAVEDNERSTTVADSRTDSSKSKNILNMFSSCEEIDFNL